MAVQRPLPADLAAIARRFHFGIAQEQLPAFEALVEGFLAPMTGLTSWRSPSGSRAGRATAGPPPARSTGGSSTGSAALVAAGEVDLAIGGDQGGSDPRQHAGL
jgi:hypothetical protein